MTRPSVKDEEQYEALRREGIDLDRDQLKDAPGFDKDNWPDLGDRTWLADVSRHFDRVPHWERD